MDYDEGGLFVDGGGVDWVWVGGVAVGWVEEGGEGGNLDGGQVGEVGGEGVDFGGEFVGEEEGLAVGCAEDGEVAFLGVSGGG